MRSLSCIAANLSLLLLLPLRALSGDYLYVTNEDNLLSVIDGERGLLIQEVQIGEPPSAVAIDQEGRWVAIGQAERRAEVWLLNRKSLEVQWKVLLHHEEEGRKADGFFLAFSNDGRRLYAVNQFSDLLYVIDTLEGKVTKRMKIGEKKGQMVGRGMVLSPDGRFLYIPGTSNKEILIVDTDRNLRQESIPIDGVPSAISISNDGKTLYVVNKDNLSLDILNLETKRIGRRIPLVGQPTHAAISRDGMFLFLSNMLSYSVTVIDTERKEAVANIPVGAYPLGIAISPDGERVYVCNYNENTVSIIDTRTNREIWRVPTASPPTRIAVYPSP